MAPNKICSNAGCTKKGEYSCSGCSEVYCSKECQVVHWETHKLVCKKKKGDSGADSPPIDSLSVKQLKHIIRSKCNDYEDNLRKPIIEEMNNLVEKEALVALATKHVNQSEVKSLLSTLPDKSASAANIAPAGRQRGGARTVTREEEVDMTKATPKQLRQQAAYLKANPAAVRRQQPHMAHMSDAEIFDAANQLEQLANDPAMLKQFRDSYSNMSDEDRESIKNLTPEQKEALKNITPEQRAEMMKFAHLSASDKKNLQIFQKGLTEKIDDEWINAVTSMLKTKPEIFKTIARSMFQGVDSAQVDSYVDYISSLSEWSIKAILTGGKWIQACARPVMSGYEVIDKWTYGSAKHIGLLLFGILMFIFVKIAFYVMGHVFQAIYAVYLMIYALVYANKSTVASVTNSFSGDAGVDTTFGSTGGASGATAGADFDF